jgi:hypothetical protein
MMNLYYYKMFSLFTCYGALIFIHIILSVQTKVYKAPNSFYSRKI